MVPTAGNTTTARVTKIVDGDTIRTTKGTIRLVGIDTPERGRCNAAKATAKTRKLVPVGSRVTLTRPTGNNNKDRYGPLPALRVPQRGRRRRGADQSRAGGCPLRLPRRLPPPRQAGPLPRLGRPLPRQALHRHQQRSGASDTYTGCRAYRPDGTSTDDQGRRYTKIDCTTKQPL